MKNQDFCVKIISLLLVVGALLGYQNFALQWEQEETANQEAVAYAEEHNAQVSALSSDETEAFHYTDGTYTGSGDGFGGTITVDVVIADSKINAVNITAADAEDTAYLNNAKGVIDNILDAQSTSVDTISGATFSSNGILSAVENALEGAKE